MISFKYVLLIIFMSMISFSYAQIDGTTKKQLNKVEKYYGAKKYSKAAELMKEVLNKYPINESLWKMYQEITFQNYRIHAKTASTYAVSVSGKNANDSLASSLQELIDYTSQVPKYEYYNALYYTSLAIPYATRVSSELRSIYVDGLYYSDKNISFKSKAFFDKADGEFRAKNYQKATEYYQKALDEDTTNYKALLYIGDSYYAMEYYGKAAEYFRKAITKQPNLLEPVKYLSDALAHKGERDRAFIVAKQSLLVYPDEGIFEKIARYLDDEGKKKLDRNWILRLSSANSIRDKNHRNQFFNDPLHFSYYIDAVNDVKEYYDEDGLLKSTVDKPLDTYLEVYCWKKMLEATQNEDIPALEYARYMEQQGMLAPYVLVSLFNVDLYPQYRHLADTKSELVKEYIDNYLIINTK